MGNTEVLRGWSHSKHYLCLQWMLLQEAQPKTLSSPQAFNTAFVNSSTGGTSLGNSSFL
jgi:GDP-D-mannose dehydratase